MERYWDLSKKQRAALTREQVEAFADVELMERGVLKVPPLALEPVPDAPKPTTTVFLVKQGGYHTVEVAFETPEAAQAFVELKPLIRSTEWCGSAHVARTSPLGEHAVFAEQVYSDAEWKAHKAAIEQAARARGANENAERERDEALRKQQAELGDMFKDWSACREAERDHRRVVETFRDYERIADGDRYVAARFLRKVFTIDQIRDAATWFEIEIPTEELPTVAPEPERVEQAAEVF